ncbi:MAG: hypothetical protein P4L85_02745 [Paludisphaera borealis]|uniref:hypothetical protein n=1 Tax=Paludisphaera borealis TaxID=1387353 RepID=UPI00283DC164|nr:hypothetical protein [Paludisphaera borealis]MDR3618240.1 hypothetical protein [Paludisphaera borealis]
MGRKKDAKKDDQPAPDGPPSSRDVKDITLKDLLLDGENPRFGEDATAGSNQISILDKIVKDYGIQDVLSSIAANGYFPTEPLVAVQKSNSSPIVVVEGNRRLAACLVLTNDPRAVNQKRLRGHFDDEPGTRITTVPVLTFSSRREILPYLGVRHIAGSMTWDGYAKAKWIAQVLDEQESLTLPEITGMIGDLNNTAPRLLEGYYFVTQLIKEDRFQPSNSQVPGRGSNPNFPFSWIYTVLGYSKTREWLGMEGTERSAPSKDPVPKDKLEKAERLVDHMFGNKIKQKRPSLSDSRELIDLARALDRPQVMSLLDDGVPLRMALDESRSAEDRAEDGLTRAKRFLTQVQSAIDSGTIARSKARKLEPLATEVRHRASGIHKALVGIMTAEDSDQDDT